MLNWEKSMVNIGRYFAFLFQKCKRYLHMLKKSCTFANFFVYRIK